MNNRLMLSVVLLWLLWLPSTLAAQTPPDQQEVSKASLSTRFGTQFDAYVAGSETAAAGVLLVPGLWGLDDKTKVWTEYLGLLGYRVVALDLYDGRPVRDLPMAREVRQSIDPLWLSSNLQGALDALSGQQRLVVITMDVATDQVDTVLAMAKDKVAAVVLVAADAGVMVGVPELRLSRLKLNKDNKARVERFLSLMFRAGE